MRQVTLSVPEDKYEFFMELMKSIDFVSVENIPIPESHKEIVRERIKNSSRGDFKSWKEVRDSLDRK